MRQVSYLLVSVYSTSFCSRHACSYPGHHVQTYATAAYRVTGRCDLRLGLGGNTDEGERQMKSRTKTKSLRIGDDKGGTNEGC
jgi:hypothetical protein